MADLGHPKPDAVALHLGVSVRTVFGYQRAEMAPRAAMLALFWESSYGKSTIDCELHNAAQVYRNLANSLEKENLMLRLRIARLESLGDFGCANTPDFAPVQAQESLMYRFKDGN